MIRSDEHAFPRSDGINRPLIRVFWQKPHDKVPDFSLFVRHHQKRRYVWPGFYRETFISRLKLQSWGILIRRR